MMLSEKNVFANLVNIYNCGFPIYFRLSILTFIPNAVDSKANNIILVREIYKRDAPICSYLLRDLYTTT